jgi:hypothetical protein
MTRKKQYISQAKQEDFIVPLIKQQIESAFKTHCRKSTVSIKVLDCGCGEQPFRDLIESLGHNYYSFDVNQNTQNSVDFLGRLDSEKINECLVTQSPFDVILLTEVLEHVLNWPLAFKNLNSISRSSTLVFITAPHFYPLHEAPYDYWRPTPFAFEEFAKISGFQVRENLQLGNALDVLGTLLSSLEIKPCYPTLSSRITTRLFKLFYHLISRLVRSKYRYVLNLRSSCYLSNFVILERL